MMIIHRKMEEGVTDFTPLESTLAKNINKFQVVLMKDKLLSEARQQTSKVLFVRIKSVTIWDTY